MSLRTLLFAAACLAASAPSRAETPLERGAYLVKHVVACGSCHTAPTPNAPELAGGQRFSTILYTAIPANLTPDPEFGIAAWTDEQLVNGMRNGKRPRGSTIGWPMPIEAYAHLSDGDAAAIAAYLRSLPPVNNKTARSTYRKALPESYGPTVTSVPAVPDTDRAATGRYLANVAGCLYCHSKPTEDGAPDFKDGLAAGGREFRGSYGQALAPALRPAAIGHYSDADLKAIITTGMRPDGRKVLPAMPYASFAGMKETDVEAIVGYLRTLKD